MRGNRDKVSIAAWSWIIYICIWQRGALTVSHTLFAIAAPIAPFDICRFLDPQLFCLTNQPSLRCSQWSEMQDIRQECLQSQCNGASQVKLRLSSLKLIAPRRRDDAVRVRAGLCAELERRERVWNRSRSVGGNREVLDGFVGSSTGRPRPKCVYVSGLTRKTAARMAFSGSSGVVGTCPSLADGAKSGGAEELF
jgi:hypothetical protein